MVLPSPLVSLASCPTSFLKVFPKIWHTVLQQCPYSPKHTWYMHCAPIFYFVFGKYSRTWLVFLDTILYWKILDQVTVRIWVFFITTPRTSRSKWFTLFCINDHSFIQILACFLLHAFLLQDIHINGPGPKSIFSRIHSEYKLFLLVSSHNPTFENLHCSLTNLTSIKHSISKT